MLKHTWINQSSISFQPFKKIIPLSLFIVAIGINIYFRLFPAYLPELKQQAQLEAENKTIQEIAQKVDDAYPDFNPLIKKKIIFKIFEEDKRKNPEFKKGIQEEYKKLKNLYQDDHGQTYILEVDGYQWMRYVKNILKNGYPGDIIKNGNSYDEYMLAPVGVGIVNNQLFFYVTAFLFHLTVFILKGLSLTSFLFYLPLFYSVAFLVLLYLLVKFYFSDIAAFFSVIFVGLNSLILLRTSCGWFDQDSIILTLPLIIIWLLSISVKNGYNLKKRLYYSIFASFVTGLYAGIWIGYWWIFGICAASYFYAIINEYSLDRKAYKKILIYVFSGAAFFIGSIIICSVFLKTNMVRDIFIMLKDVLHLGDSQQASLWPDTYYTVGELIRTNPKQIMWNLGGPGIVIFTLVGLLVVYLKEKRSEKKDFIMFMIFWIFAMCLAAEKSFRFIAFLAIPLGVFFGIFIETIFKYLFAKFRNQPRLLLSTLSLFSVFILWSGGVLIDNASMQAKTFRPLMNDNWQKALAYIKKNTPQNSIINSWWDYGNFFKTISDRRVIFDPQSQNNSLSYWMANILVSGNEKRIINTLRMLNNTSYTLFNDMLKEMKDDFRCIVLLEKILDSNEEEAEKILEKQNISEKLKKEIMEAVFLKEPAPAYFVVDKTMPNKMYNISFLGNWSFPKVYVMKHRQLPKNKIIENLVKIFALPQAEAENIYNEVTLAATEDETNEVLSKRYSFNVFTNKGEKEGKFICFDNGIILDLSDFTSCVFSLDKGYKVYKNTFIYDGENLSAYENKGTDYNESALFLKDKNTWQVVNLPKEMINSLFTKLYFFNASGLKYFEPFYADDNAGIYIYKIKWPKNNPVELPPKKVKKVIR